MNVEQMRVGVEASSKEMDFIQKVVAEIRQSYDGPIRVVGSRKDGHRISTKAYHFNCLTLPPEEYEKWQAKLDEIAREHDISAGEMQEVLEYLPEDVPDEVKSIFKRARHIDSDLDLAIDEEIGSIQYNYYDEQPPEGSGLVIEIYEPGDSSWARVSNYSF